MRPGEDRLPKGHPRTDLIGYLAAPTGNVVGISQVPVAIDHKERAGKFVTERVTRVKAHHQIGREIGSPRSRVRQIIFSIKPIVSDQASEDSTLHSKAFAYWG